MGRDQVKRNQAARGRGRGGAGGRGGGGGAGGKTNRRSAGKSSSSSALSLGDNSHRYDHRSSRSSGVDEYDDDDDDGRMEAFDTAFAHYDASLSSLKRRDDDSLDFSAKDTGPTTRHNADRNVDNNDDETRARNSWMEIDIKALDKCLQQHIPLHVRLHVPLHIASHIEERYGGNQNRKKTLAELREESKCTVSVDDDDDDGCASSSIIGAISECSNHDEFTNVVQVDGGINEKDEADKDDNDDDDDDDEDLEAWLDDVIS